MFYGSSDIINQLTTLHIMRQNKMICISTRSSIIRLLTIDVTTSTFVVVRPVYKPIAQRLSKVDLISHILACEGYDVFIYALNCYSYKSIPFSSYINK